MPDPASPKTYRIRRAASYPRRPRGRQWSPRARNVATSGIYVSCGLSAPAGTAGNSRSLAYAFPRRADAFGPGRRARRHAPRLRAAGRAGCARGCGRAWRSRRASTSSPRRAPAPARASATCSRRSSRASGSSSRRRRRRSRSSSSRSEVPAAARALGRELDVAVLKGRQNYLCRKQLQGFGPMLLRDAARRGRRSRRSSRGSRETETGDRAELPFEPSEALWAELAVGLRPLRGPQVRAALDLLRRGRAVAGGRRPSS